MKQSFNPKLWPHWMCNYTSCSQTFRILRRFSAWDFKGLASTDDLKMCDFEVCIFPLLDSQELLDIHHIVVRTRAIEDYAYVSVSS